MKKARINRQTRETRIELSLNIEGSGNVSVETGIPFFNHMLEAMGRHARFDLEIRASGDLEVDEHHTVEDVGICLGSAVREIYLKNEGLNRSGFFVFPMDEALALVSIDLSGRTVFDFPEPPEGLVGSFNPAVLYEFFAGFANSARATVHIRVLSGRNLHHIYEAVFKAFGRALDEALSEHPRDHGIPSTKGLIE